MTSSDQGLSFPEERAWVRGCCEALPCAEATPNDINDEKVTDIVSSDDNVDGDEQDGILGDSDVSFDNDASDDQDSDTNANKEQCAP